MLEPADTVVKLAVAGESGVGKTRNVNRIFSLTTRLVTDKFDPYGEVPTIGCDHKVMLFHVGSMLVKASIWDTAGQERFRTITSSFYRHAAGAVLVYDINERSTFDALDYWLRELELNAVRPGCIKLLVGNKVDKNKRVIDRGEAIKYAQKHEMMFMETSALTSENVHSAFQELIEKVIANKNLWDPLAHPSVSLYKQQKKSGCYRCT